MFVTARRQPLALPAFFVSMLLHGCALLWWLSSPNGPAGSPASANRVIVSMSLIDAGAGQSAVQAAHASAGRSSSTSVAKPERSSAAAPHSRKSSVEVVEAANKFEEVPAVGLAAAPASVPSAPPEAEPVQWATRSFVFSGRRSLRAQDQSPQRVAREEQRDLLKEGLARAAWSVADQLVSTGFDEGACEVRIGAARVDSEPDLNCEAASADAAMRAVPASALQSLVTWMRANDVAAIEFRMEAGRAQFGVLR